MNIIHLTPDQVPAHLKAGYSGRKFKVEVTTQVTVPADAGLWSGGSRDTYSVVQLSTGSGISASNNMSWPWDGTRKDLTVTIEPGFAIVRSSMFCGKDMGLTFYVHPSDAAQLLPAPNAELSKAEQIVLDATCSLKSSYNGKDRYQMTLENDHSAVCAIPTRAHWDAAKQSLIGKGMLNKAGAVTVAGRNARKRT